MTVDELIEELKALSTKGYGEETVYIDNQNIARVLFMEEHVFENFKGVHIES